MTEIKEICDLVVDLIRSGRLSICPFQWLRGSALIKRRGGKAREETFTPPGAGPGLKEVTLWSPRCRCPLSSLGARTVIGVLGGNCAMMVCFDGRAVVTDLFVGSQMGMPLVLMRWKREISRFSETGRNIKGGGGEHWEGLAERR